MDPTGVRYVAQRLNLFNIFFSLAQGFNIFGGLSHSTLRLQIGRQKILYPLWRNGID